MTDPLFFRVELPDNATTEDAQAAASELQELLVEAADIAEPEVMVKPAVRDAAAIIEVAKLVGTVLGTIPAFVKAYEAIRDLLRRKEEEKPLTPAQRLVLATPPENVIVIVDGQPIRLSEIPDTLQ